jgi:hypothetical protein
VEGIEMSEKFEPVEPEMVACEVCLKEIPESVAQSMEGEDYVHHFCGLECFERWKIKQRIETSKANA